MWVLGHCSLTASLETKLTLREVDTRFTVDKLETIMSEPFKPEDQMPLENVEEAPKQPILELLTPDVGEIEPIFVNMGAKEFFLKLLRSGLIPVESMRNSDGTFDVAHYNPDDLPQTFQPYTQEGALVDYPATIAKINELKAQRRKLDSQASALKAQQNELEEAVMSSLFAQGIVGTKVQGFSVGINSQPKYSVLDWDALYAHIKENSAFELLNKALKNASVKDLVSEGYSPEDLKAMGIDPDPFVTKSLSIRKAA